MPELPEVESVRQGLQRWTRGRAVRTVDVLADRAVRRHGPGPADFQDRLSGEVLRDVHRRGKFLWWSCDNLYVVAHLGMSGQFRVDCDPGPHTRLVLTFDDDGPDLLFEDQRTFGGLWLDDSDGSPTGPRSLGHIAADPFADDYRQSEVVAAIRSRRAPVKALLLDQGLVSGIGNIYADEALWLSRVHWATPGNRLGRGRLENLLDAARQVMADALDAGGTSFDRLYVNVNGSSGYFQRHLNAYGREGEPCPRCGTAIVRESFANRSSYRCPRCQRRR